jgi:CheY-like chemotaxis protein
MSDSAVRVLIVDDDRAIRETLRAALEEEGYAVVEAGDGLRALEILRAHSTPHMVLLDLRMPVMDGIDVLRTVAADARLTSRHAYAIITANQELVPVALGGTKGRLSIPVLLKPFDLDTVLETVEAAVCGLAPSIGDAYERARDAAF